MEVAIIPRPKTPERIEPLVPDPKWFERQGAVAFPTSRGTRLVLTAPEGLAYAWPKAEHPLAGATLELVPGRKPRLIRLRYSTPFVLAAWWEKSREVWATDPALAALVRSLAPRDLKTANTAYAAAFLAKHRLPVLALVPYGDPPHFCCASRYVTPHDTPRQAAWRVVRGEPVNPNYNVPGPDPLLDYDPKTDRFRAANRRVAFEVLRRHPGWHPPGTPDPEVYPLLQKVTDEIRFHLGFNHLALHLHQRILKGRFPHARLSPAVPLNDAGRELAKMLKAEGFTPYTFLKVHHWFEQMPPPPPFAERRAGEGSRAA